MKDYGFNIGMALIFYFFMSVFALLIRMSPGFGKPPDCKHRYVDYIFPLSKIHCEVGQ